MNERFETEFGDDGFRESHGSLKPFGALYRFQNRIWGITVWAHDWTDAEQYCDRHGLKLDGLILDVIDY